MKDGQKPSFFPEKISGCNLHQPDTLAGKVEGKVEGLLSRIDLVGLGMRLESLPSAHHPLGAVDFHEQVNRTLRGPGRSDEAGQS